MSAAGARRTSDAGATVARGASTPRDCCTWFGLTSSVRGEVRRRFCIRPLGHAGAHRGPRIPVVPFARLEGAA
jgi:hypothetical protein